MSLENIIFAGRILEKKPITKEEVVSYARLLKYLVDDILEEKWQEVEEHYKNLLIGVYNRNLKEVSIIEEQSEGDYLRFCERICEVR